MTKFWVVGAQTCFKNSQFYCQNVHVYEPESRLWCLEHRDWPTCGRKCSTESGSTARRRLDHPETIMSSEKRTARVPWTRGNAHRRNVLAAEWFFRTFTSSVCICENILFLLSKKNATIRSLNSELHRDYCFDEFTIRVYVKPEYGT